jgi:hypothetical protein
MRLRSTRLRCSAAPASHFAVLPSTHSYGDTRMGDNRETNVVNRWGFSHEVPNMGILGGSVMGTSGAHNPTLTAPALASECSSLRRVLDPAVYCRRPSRVGLMRTSPANADGSYLTGLGSMDVSWAPSQFGRRCRSRPFGLAVIIQLAGSRSAATILAPSTSAGSAATQEIRESPSQAAVLLTTPVCHTASIIGLDHAERGRHGHNHPRISVRL